MAADDITLTPPVTTAKLRRDPPPALDITVQFNTAEERDPKRQVCTYFTGRQQSSHKAIAQPSVLVTPTGEQEDSEPDFTSLPRSVSATSSLDPYYFGLSDSPVPPLPTGHLHISTTPDQLHSSYTSDPVTPAKDPALIDRRGLIGVGELTTPRWTRSSHNKEDTVTPVLDSVGEGYEDHIGDGDLPDDHPDSPWTIEAVDGEVSDPEQAQEVKPAARTLRERPSMTEESGGEEILYPRSGLMGPVPELPSAVRSSSEITQADEKYVAAPLDLAISIVEASPPSSFAQSRKARKRSSDEFEHDNSGSLVSNRASSGPSKERVSRDEKFSTRKHRSLNVGSPTRTKERRRESLGLSHSSSLVAASTAKGSERHSRQASASSVSSTQRGHNTDFSHLPPSPSSTSILSFLKHQGPNVPSQTPPLVSSSSRDSTQSHSSPNVAHSLLRGTQEGWSGLDDEATTEALRKLDGLSGKSARARASVASFTRSSSRPGTPAKASGQWEGIGLIENNRRDSVVDGSIIDSGAVDSSDLIGSALSSDEQPLGPSNTEKTPKKGTTSARSSFTPKRGSTSSTTYASTPTTSSRDSAQMSVTTAATSVSAASSRHSLGKTSRNSIGSDASSIHSSEATSLRERVAALATAGEPPEETPVPPVPPLPKDLSTYRSPPPTSIGLTFPALQDDRSERVHVVSLEVPSAGNPTIVASQPYSAGYTSQTSSGPESSSALPKTPSKKWSISNALNLRLSSSPSSGAVSSPKSPRAVTFGGQHSRKSLSKEKTLSPAQTGGNPWEQPAAMSSAASLTSLSSVGSVRSPGLLRKTPDRGAVASRTGTDSSASTNNTTAALSPQSVPMSPGSSMRRNQSKRLTPSSIPFFRRSSSQSMQIPAPAPSASSPTQSSSRSAKADSDYNPAVSTSTPGKKSSVLSLLKGSSSRRSLHADSKEAAKELQRLKDAEKDKERLAKAAEKERLKKEERDRSESRISVLMGRKRGKTLSSTDPPARKVKSPVHLPPLQMAAIEPVTAQRVARLKSSSTSSSPASTPSVSSRTASASRITSATVSSMQKQSDSSLRTRNQLPTIAGSPSVAGGATVKDVKEPPPVSMNNSVSGLPKETPTKIPRISSRTSTVSSPLQRNHVGSRRASATIGPSSNNPSPTILSTNEFGVIDGEDVQGQHAVKTITRTGSIRASPATLSTAGASTGTGTTSRVARQSTGTAASSSSTMLTRKNRESVSFTGLRKSSTTSGPAPESSSNSHRFSALSPSRGLKLLSPKIGLSSSKNSNSTSTQSIHQVANSPSSSRQSLSTPSPDPASLVDEEEVAADEEMMQYIRRQQAKKLQAGASQEELDDLLRFPEPLAPGTAYSPAAILGGSQNQYLSAYERKEMLDFPSVYFIGPQSKKKPAVPEISTNNYGYDDDRGDYLVVNHDHLAYRYEVIDTLGKGSFGQVLHCRDHCTGESVAIKIIRNKKRFHHQAIVEIKILDNLRKWDPDEKHYVIKMTEHFYFRNHLCIAMELLSINLYELIKANNFAGFTTTLIRRFTTQMLMSLSLMRHHRIVHCDLKPENVLLRHPAKSSIKVIDFGSSCLEHEKIYTYIQSRFYRSPEVILGMNYHMAIDMWSLGCILAELFTGFPIFPGENEQEQLSCIMEVLGIPDKEFVNKSSRKKLFFDPNGAPRVVVNSKGRRRRPGTKTLAQVLRCTDEDFIDFIAKCLIWDPERRIKPQAALRHPFVVAGKRPRPLATPAATLRAGSSSNLAASTLGSSRTKHVMETPKKSLISAPTPLTARTSRTTTSGNVPTTPSNSSQPSTVGSSRSYRASQSQSLSTYHSSRTVTAGK
ncbi:unnamed protein product [Mycena citricolor]|uniref:dual-specificity kinase n=1 Tax=Mycena citricolor TaxID=2018698 RepID=A0AAD2K585_9AGAR|nr:unnamed protein product [Mycena citricolor]